MLGNTGAGKSTLINYLCGCEMENARRRDIGLSGRGSVIRVKADQRDTAVTKIGHDMQKSATFLPSVAVSTTDGKVYCDCPGFLDNRGAEINIANACNIKQMIAQAKSVRVVVLINYDSLKADRGRGVKDLAKVRARIACRRLAPPRACHVNGVRGAARMRRGFPAPCQSRY